MAGVSRLCCIEREPGPSSRGSCLSRGLNEGLRVRHLRVTPFVQPPGSAFAGFRFPPEIILIAVRWYLRYGLSYRDLEELLAERGIEVDHVTLFRWVQRFTPLLVEAARPCRHRVGGHWFVDETYVKVSGSWRVRLPSGRPIRAGHRRVRVENPRPQGSERVLRHRHPLPR